MALYNYAYYYYYYIIIIAEQFSIYRANTRGVNINDYTVTYFYNDIAFAAINCACYTAQGTLN